MTLNKMDQYLLQNLKRLADTGYKDEYPRAKYEDGTPAHSISITGGVYEVFDLSKGEYPITESRPIPWKSSINEMLAIYQSQTNTQEGFESHNVGWWKDWCNEQGNIGRAYAYNLESHRPGEMKREVVKVKRKIIKDEFKKIKETPLQNEIMKSIDDKIYENYDNPFIIIDNRFKITDNGTYIYRIQFLKSGYIKEIRGNDLNQSIKKNRLLKDPFSRSYYGIGYLGDYKKIKMDKEILNILIIKWESMIKRCYGTNQNYKIYKDKGVFVHQDWHCFANFLRDVKQIPQYFLAKEEKFKGWELDKDYYASNCYSKETCTFLKSQENTLYAKMRPLKVKNKITGENKLFLEIEKCAEYFNFSKSGLKTALYRPERLKRGNYVNYEFKFVDDENIYRYELSRNQINYLLENLKNNPFSKRHIVSFYHWSNIDKKMLVECAYETLWTVRKSGEDLYLDMSLIHRSSDLLIAGTGINQIQYVALQMMVAKHCGYKVGLFEHYRKNVHVYDRHEEQLIETINRLDYLDEMRKESKIEFKLNVPDGTCFYDIDIDNFELIGYNPIKPQLKFDLAI